jgi:hypothetical protein
MLIVTFFCYLTCLHWPGGVILYYKSVAVICHCIFSNNHFIFLDSLLEVVFHLYGSLVVDDPDYWI